MAETFHSSEQGNLVPLKARSRDLKIAATQLAKSRIAAEFNSVMLRTVVIEIKKESRTLHQLVKNGSSSDKQLTHEISALHDVFHKIVGLCRQET